MLLWYSGLFLHQLQDWITSKSLAISMLYNWKYRQNFCANYVWWKLSQIIWAIFLQSSATEVLVYENKRSKYSQAIWMMVNVIDKANWQRWIWFIAFSLGTLVTTENTSVDSDTKVMHKNLCIQNPVEYFTITDSKFNKLGKYKKTDVSCVIRPIPWQLQDT